MTMFPSAPSLLRPLPAVFAALGSALLFSAPAVLAQGASKIDEIVVTAQKREQSLQDTPIAISALSAEAIDRQDIRDVKALNGIVPNLRLVPPPTAATGATVNIRGAVTINPALHIEPTVGMYLDGIYLGKSVGGIFDVADLERVEVLRGPQGTLYGKNTTGGAINLITKKPTGEFGGDLKVSIGDYSLRSGKFAVDLPGLGAVGEGAGRLSTKFVLSRTTRDGFVTNENLDLPGALPASGRDFNNINSTSGRFAALWQPVDSVDVSYSYDASRVDQRPRYFQITRLDPALQGLLGQFASTSRQTRGSENAALSDKADVDGHGLIASWNAGTLGFLGDVTFKSLTGHRKVKAHDEQDWDGSPYDLLSSGRKMTYKAISQEFQMLGQTERSNYVGGLYYFKEEGDVLNPLALTLFGAPPEDARYGFDNKAWAVYAQYEFTPPILDDRMKLILGGRYTREDKEIYRYDEIGGFVRVDYLSFDKSYGNFSPSAVLSFQVTDAINTYVKVARGWKAGVFNAESNDPVELDNPIKSEIVTSYELGVKIQTADNRLRANFAYFYNDVKDIQISTFIPATGASQFSNAGKAEIQGAELELTAIPIDNLELSLGYGYLDAKYKEYVDLCRPTVSGANPCPAGVSPGDFFDAKNVNEFPYSPKNTVNASIQYTQPLPVGEAVARVDWRYTDEYAIFPDPFNYENTSIKSYALTDIRLLWDKVPVGDSELAVSGWVKNVGNKHYRVNGLEWGPFTMMNYGDPRTFGFDVALKF